MYALMYVGVRANVKLDYRLSNKCSVYIYIDTYVEQRYGTEVWNGSVKQVWNGGMERRYGTAVVPDHVPDLVI